MAHTFHLQIVTPGKTVFDGDVESVVAPGLEGSFGVLAHHAPLIAALGKGKLIVRAGRNETTYPMEGGFLEVSNNHCVLVVEKISVPTGTEQESA